MSRDEMSSKVVSSLTLNCFQKYSCAHGSWATISHAAHLIGNPSILINNASNAIQCLLKRHPRMRTRLRVDNDQYLLDFFEYNSEYLSSDLFFSTVETNHDSWKEIVEHRCNQDPYSNDGTIIFPLFHFMILFNSEQSNDNGFHLIIFENHCASDGRSGFVLINDFLTLATTPNLLVTSETLNTEILPSISAMIPRPFGPLYPVPLFIAKKVFKYELRQLVRPRIPVKAIPHADCNPSKFGIQRYKMKFLFASSSSNLYPTLYQQCRLHEVTLNGPLFACLLLSIHHCFPLDNNTQLVPFGISCNFDMRSRLPQSPLTPSSVGCFAGISEVKFFRSLSIESTRFWTFAHKCMTITRDQLNRIGVPLIMHMFADITEHERDFDQFNRLFPEGRQSEFAFSNIGKYPFSCEYNQGEIQLKGLHFINNSSLYRASSLMFVSCAGDGQLDYSFAHEMESEEKAKEFFDYYVHLIEICADNARCKDETTLDQLLKATE
jgi:hypothetical protein